MSKKLLAFFQLIRINEYYGNTVALTLFGGLFNQVMLDISHLGRFFVVNLLITAFAFAINDIEDAPDDALDKSKVKRNPLSAGRLDSTEARLFTWSLAALAVVFVWPVGTNGILLTLTGLVLGYLYSYKAVRLKSMPILDLVSHGLFLGLIQFLLPATAFGSPITALMILAAGAIFLISVLGDVRNELRDWEVDRETGINNTAAVANLKAIEPYLDILYVLPVLALLYAISELLPQGRQVLTLAFVVGGTVLYLALPKKLRLKLSHDYVQVLVVIISLASTLLFY